MQLASKSFSRLLPAVQAPGSKGDAAPGVPPPISPGSGTLGWLTRATCRSLTAATCRSPLQVAQVKVALSSLAEYHFTPATCRPDSR